MRISCPKCQTEYDVPEAALTGRARTLRCATCMTKWQVPALEMYRAPDAPAPDASTPEAPPGAMEPAAPHAGPEAPGDAAMTEPAAPLAGEPDYPELPLAERVSMLRGGRGKQPSSEPPSAGRGLALSVLVVLLIIVVVLVEHRPIANFWPPSLRLFNALGLR